MRVLLLTDWTAEEGGVERYVDLLARGLRAAGDDVRLLVSAEGPAAGRADYAVRCGSGAFAQGVLQLANPLAAAGVRRAVRTFRPDVAHVSMFEIRLSPSVFGALGAVPAVANVTSYKPFCPTTHRLLPDGRLCQARAGRVCANSGCLSRARVVREVPRYALIGSALRRAAAIAVASVWMRDVLVAERLDAVVTGRPWQPAGPSFRRTPTARPRFVSIGRLSPEKGIDLLLRALAAARAAGVDATLRVAGDGPIRPALERLATQLGLGDSVRFTGFLDRDGIDALLAEAWACVVPSRWAEPFGNVALDAVARGVPVVGSAVGGLGEIVEHGVGGLLVRNGDLDDLTAALRAVADGAFADNAVPAATVQRVREESSLEAHVGRMRALFDQVAR